MVVIFLGVVVRQFHLVVFVFLSIVGLSAEEYRLELSVVQGKGLTQHSVFYNKIINQTELLEDFFCDDFSVDAFCDLVKDIQVFLDKELAENNRLGDFRDACEYLNNFLKNSPAFIKLSFKIEIVSFFDKFKEAIFSTADFEYVKVLEKFLRHLYCAPKYSYESIEDGEKIYLPGKYSWNCLYPIDSFKVAISSLRIDTSNLLKKEYVWRRLEKFFRLASLSRASAYSVIQIFMLEALCGHGFFLKAEKELLKKFKHNVLALKIGLSTSSTKKIDYTESDFDAFISSLESEEDKRCVLACLQNVLFTYEHMKFEPPACFYKDDEPVFELVKPIPEIAPVARKKKKKKKKKKAAHSGQEDVALVVCDSDTRAIELAAAEFLLGQSDVVDGLLLLAGAGSHVFEAPDEPSALVFSHDVDVPAATEDVLASPSSTGSYESQSIATGSPHGSLGGFELDSPVEPLGGLPFALDGQHETFAGRESARRQKLLDLTYDFSDSFVHYSGKFKPCWNSFLSDDEVIDLLDEFEVAYEILFIKKLLSLEAYPSDAPFLFFKSLKLAVQDIKRGKVGVSKSTLLKGAFRSCAVVKKEVSELQRNFLLKPIKSNKKLLAEKTNDLRKFKNKITELLGLLPADEWAAFCAQYDEQNALSKKACIEILNYSTGLSMIAAA